MKQACGTAKRLAEASLSDAAAAWAMKLAKQHPSFESGRESQHGGSNLVLSREPEVHGGSTTFPRAMWLHNVWLVTSPRPDIPLSLCPPPPASSPG
jgi:hypothetical protein